MRKCTHPDQCLYYFSKRGDWRNIRLALKKGATDFNRALAGAAYGGNLDVMKFLIDEKGAKNLDQALSLQLTTVTWRL